MPFLTPSLRLTGARVLCDSMLADTAISVVDGVIAEHGGPDLDLAGYLVMPGIIDLHGDAFEHHMAPRPSAPFPLHTGLEIGRAHV